jgi:hypothetical protein
MGNTNDYAHLDALEESLQREIARLAFASTETEKAFRNRCIEGKRKEIAGERKFLGLSEFDSMSADELAAELEGL